MDPNYDFMTGIGYNLFFSLTIEVLGGREEWGVSEVGDNTEWDVPNKTERRTLLRYLLSYLII